MRRNILFIVLLFAALTALSALQKPIFLLWYAELVADAEWSELLGVISNGISLDMTMAGYVCAVPILLILLSIWYPHKLWGKVCRGWLYTASVIVAICFSVNLGLYEYWRFPLDGSIVQYLATPAEAMASVTPQLFVIQTVVAVIYGAMLIVVVREIAKILLTEHRERLYLKVVWSVVVLIVAGLDFLAIRGGVSTAVANVSKVYFSDNIALNHAAVNPTFSFISSLSAGDDLSRYDYFDAEQCDKQFEALTLGCGQSSVELLSEKRPNIVMIIAESLGRSTMDEVVGGELVAPKLNSYKREGVWFENMIASSFRTDRGVLATLSGVCAQPTMSLMKYPQKASKLPSIAEALHSVGYNTAYIHGGDLNFTDMASYLYATGFERLVDIKNLKFDAPTSKWGYADDVMADYFIDYIEGLSGSDTPYFAVWQTLSSHEPFDVPTEVFEDKMLNSMHFADSCIGRVIESLKSSGEWDRTLVVIIADHAYLYPYGISASAVERHRIPMLWLGGALKEAGVVDCYCSQTDLAATLLSQLGIDKSRFTMSRDIFDSGLAKFGYYTFNNGFGVVDSSGKTIYDCTTESVISEENEAEKVTVGKTMLQSTYKIIKQL